jgi:hypothetical protein
MDCFLGFKQAYRKHHTLPVDRLDKNKTVWKTQWDAVFYHTTAKKDT